MARWWKRWTGLAGGLVGLTAWLAPAHAQEPIGMPSLNEFPRLGAPQPPQQGPPPHPLSMEVGSRPNGFSDEEYYRQPEPYVLKIKGEYMFWHVALPRLAAITATTSNQPNLVNGVGAIGDPGTSILLGTGTYDYRENHGCRLTAGLALGVIPPIEVSGWWTSKAITLLNRGSDGSQNSPVLGRPFQAPNLPSLNGQGQEVVLSAGFPGLLKGDITVAADMSLHSFETNVFFNLGESDVAGLDVIAGYRHAYLQESLTIANSVATISDAVNISFNSVNLNGLPQGFTSIATDSFRTRNSFNGGTIGLRPSLYVGQFTTTVDMKLALGSTHETLFVGGTSTLLSPNTIARDPQVVPGGLLAVASNSGSFGRSTFTFIPELNVNVGFNITRMFKLFATYNIFYWSNVVRPGDHLDNRVDSRQVPTDPTFDPTIQASTPGRRFITRDFWAHGFTLGLEIGF